MKDHKNSAITKAILAFIVFASAPFLFVIFVSLFDVDFLQKYFGYIARLAIALFVAYLAYVFGVQRYLEEKRVSRLNKRYVDELFEKSLKEYENILNVSMANYGFYQAYLRDVLQTLIDADPDPKITSQNVLKLNLENKIAKTSIATLSSSDKIIADILDIPWFSDWASTVRTSAFIFNRLQSSRVESSIKNVVKHIAQNNQKDIQQFILRIMQVEGSVRLQPWQFKDELAAIATLIADIIVSIDSNAVSVQDLLNNKQGVLSLEVIDRIKELKVMADSHKDKMKLIAAKQEAIEKNDQKTLNISKSLIEFDEKKFHELLSSIEEEINKVPNIEAKAEDVKSK